MPTTDAVPFGIPVELAGHQYIVDLAGYRRRTLPALREQFDTANEPGEQSLSSEGLWRRSQSDWRAGEGQLHYDDRDSLRNAFYQSSKVDVWDEGGIKLLKEPEAKVVNSSTSQHLLTESGYLYHAAGSTLAFTADATPASPTFTGVNIQAGQAAQTVQDITSDGGYIYAALGSNGVTRTSLATTTASKISTYNATLIEYANGRLLVSNGRDITELTSISGSTSTATSIWEHPNAGFTFNAASGGNRGIYFAGRSGDRSEVYIIKVNESDGSLTTPVVVATLPIGEYVQSMGHYGAAMLLGTNKGFRLAAIQDDGSLVYGPRVDIANGVRCFAFEAEYAWFGWSGWPDVEPTGDVDPHLTGLGRMNLSMLTEPLVPAYNTDLMVGSEGVPNTAATLAVARFNGRTYFCISGDGLYGESGSYEESGYLWSGWIRYGLTENKVVSQIDLRHEPLVGTVVAELLTEDLEVTTVGTSSAGSSLSPIGGLRREVNIGEAAMLKLTLTQGGVTQTPVLKRWTIRALPTPERIDEVILPIILRERMTFGEGDGQSYYYDTKAEFDYLQSFVGSGSILDYREGNTTYKVYLDRVEEQPDQWNSQRTFFNGVLVLRLLVVDEV